MFALPCLFRGSLSISVCLHESSSSCLICTTLENNCCMMFNFLVAIPTYQIIKFRFSVFIIFYISRFYNYIIYTFLGFHFLPFPILIV
jgi:hypothetical protein